MLQEPFTLNPQNNAATVLNNISLAQCLLMLAGMSCFAVCFVFFFVFHQTFAQQF